MPETATTPPPRTIIHADLDAFFASVEQLDHPELRGKPVLVGGTGNRGVVTAASYEARVFGCKSAQPMAVARRLCPHAIVVKGSFARYRELSAKVFEIFERTTPVIEPLSIDEAFLDVTGSLGLLGDGRSIAQKIRREVLDETGLVVSVGVATSKFVAKVASDLDKPDGLRVVEPGTERDTLARLAVSRMFGIGPAAEKRLRAFGVRTIGDLARLPIEVASARLGSHAETVWQRANGIDSRPVVTDRERKSIGHEQTFGVDLTDRDEIMGVVLEQCAQVARRARRAERTARGVTLKLRAPDFSTITRSHTLDPPTDQTDPIYQTVRALFETWAARSFHPIRLVGVSLAPLLSRDTLSRQGGLFDQQDSAPSRLAGAERAADAIAERFGNDAIGRAASLKAKRPRDP